MSAPRLNLVAQGEGAAFVFQHGLCGDAAQAAEPFPAEAGFRLLTLECRGHGASEAGDLACLSIATFADDVAAMMLREHAAPAIVGGISMGAAIALRLVVRSPELVRALVLARPAWVADPAPDNLEPYAEVGTLMARLDPDEARAAFDLSETAARLAREAPDNLVSLRGFFDRAPRDTTSALLTRIAADGPGVSEAEIAAIAVPTLVIGHAEDAAHPLAMAERLPTLIPGAQLVRITPKGSDRARYVADFRAALAGFLSQHRAES